MLNKIIQKSIRNAHICLRSRPLPDALGVFWHDLAEDKIQGMRECLQFLSKGGYRFVDPAEFIHGEGKRVHLSFDDSYVTWVENLDLFDEFGAIGTFYTNTIVLRGESSETVEKDYYRRINKTLDVTPLSRSEIVEIRTRGHTIGSHTHSHFNLADLAYDVACEEIRRCKETLEEILGEPVPHFSYPFGMPRHMTSELRDYCLANSIETIADATPGLQFVGSSARHLRRTLWKGHFPTDYNIASLKVDGSFFAKLTGRSAIG